MIPITRDPMRGRFGAAPRGGAKRRWVTGRLALGRRTFGILILQRRAGALPIHRRVGRRAAPLAWLPFVWRCLARQGVRVEPSVALLRCHLNLWYRRTLVRLNLVHKRLSFVRRSTRGASHFAYRSTTRATGVRDSTRAGPRRRREAQAERASRPAGAPLRRQISVQPPAVPRPGTDVVAVTYRHRDRTAWRDRRSQPASALIDGRRQFARSYRGYEFVRSRVERGRSVSAPRTRLQRTALMRLAIRRPRAEPRYRREVLPHRPQWFGVLWAMLPVAARFQAARGAISESQPLVAVRRAEQARHVIYGPSSVPPPAAARPPASPTARSALKPGPLALPIAEQPAVATAIVRSVVHRPMSVRPASLPSVASSTTMTHVLQHGRHVTNEADRKLLEQDVVQNVTRSVSENLARTVQETVRREVVANANTRSALIEQLGSDLYDRVVLERERLG